MKQRKAIICKSKYAVIFLVMFLLAGNLFAVSHSENFNVNDLEFSVEERGYDKIKLGDLLITTERGEPELPVKLVNLIIPIGTEVDDIMITVDQQTLVGTYFINPSPGPVPIGEIPDPAEPNPAIYNSANIFPDKCVKVLSHGYFDGANRIVSLAIYPVQYIPVDQILVFNGNINFTFSFTSSDQPVAYPKYHTTNKRDKTERALKSIVENDADVQSYMYRPVILNKINDSQVSDYIDFVIIGPADLAPEFSDFMEWKRKKGLKIQYESLSNIYANYPNGDDWHSHSITDMAGRIRAYLKDKYENNGLEYAIIVGGESDYDNAPDPNDEMLPVRYSCQTHDTWIGYADPNDPNYQDNNSYRIASDIYFADFDGDYDVDGEGNGYYGENEPSGSPQPDDDIDKFVEIYVGRLVVSSQEDVPNDEQIRRWTEKLITYETDPGYGDFNYLMKSLLLNGYWTTTGSSRIYENSFDDLLNQYMAQFNICYTTQSPAWPTGVEVIDEMSQGYGITHSYYHGIKSRISDYAITSGYQVYALDKYAHGINLDGDGLDNLAEGDGKYSIHFSVSCRVGKYDDSTFEYSGELGAKICFAESFTTFTEAKGGPVIIANTHDGYGGTSEDIEDYFLDDVFLNEFTVGEALANAKTHTSHHVLILCTTLFGDPSLEIWTGSPSQYTNVSVTDDGSSITVNTGVSGSNICVT